MVGIQGALQDDPLFDMPTTNREVSFELLVSSQNDMGWSHLLRGRFSRHWVQIQQDHMDHEHEVIPRNPQANAGFKRFSIIYGLICRETDHERNKAF